MTLPVQNGIDLNLALPNDVKSLVEYAARIRGQTVEEFATATLLEAAQEVVDRQSMTVLSERDLETVASLLENPPAPTEALREAVKDYKERHAGHEPNRLVG